MDMRLETEAEIGMEAEAKTEMGLKTSRSDFVKIFTQAQIRRSLTFPTTTPFSNLLRRTLLILTTP